MELDLENPLTSSDEEQQRGGYFSALFSAESDHMISTAGAIDLSVRQDAVSLVLQAQFDCKLGTFLAYLAINYIDRFLSKRKITRKKPWIVRLLSISCLSLASKMMKTSFAIADFQREEGFTFDDQTIRRMELLVLGALDWRMRSITPFSFVPYFISFFCPAQPHLLQDLKAHAIQILFRAQKENKLMEYKASVVAASALLSAAYELFPIQFPVFLAAISSCEFVKKEKLWECSSAIGDSEGCFDLGATELASSFDTAVTFLGRHCSSSESEFTVGFSSDGRDLKKRRIASALHAPRDHDG